MNDNPRPFGPHHDGARGEWARLGTLVREDVESAWPVLLDVTATTDDAGLFWVADIVEDMITAHGRNVYPRLEAELRKNRKLRQAFVLVVPGHADPHVEEDFFRLRERIEAEDQEASSATTDRVTFPDTH